MSKPIPVAVCGQHAHIAELVKLKMQPEYEGAVLCLLSMKPSDPNIIVIHTVLSVEEGVSLLPALLRGDEPPPGGAETIGTKNYSAPAKAVVTGGDYDDSKLSKLREACKGSEVPWLRNDKSKPAPPPGPAYGAALVERVKALLSDLEKRGEMQKDGVYWY